jgi:hypothetical protein
MIGKVRIFGIKDRRPADDAGKHGGLEIVHHDFLRYAAEQQFPVLN